jgi:hypothetical protein
LKRTLVSARVAPAIMISTVERLVPKTLAPDDRDFFNALR